MSGEEEVKLTPQTTSKDYEPCSHVHHISGARQQDAQALLIELDKPDSPKGRLMRAYRKSGKTDLLATIAQEANATDNHRAVYLDGGFLADRSKFQKEFCRQHIIHLVMDLEKRNKGRNISPSEVESLMGTRNPFDYLAEYQKNYTGTLPTFIVMYDEFTSSSDLGQEMKLLAELVKRDDLPNLRIILSNPEHTYFEQKEELDRALVDFVPHTLRPYDHSQVKQVLEGRLAQPMRDEEIALIAAVTGGYPYAVSKVVDELQAYETADEEGVIDVLRRIDREKKLMLGIIANGTPLDKLITEDQYALLRNISAVIHARERTQYRELDAEVAQRLTPDIKSLFTYLVNSPVGRVKLSDLPEEISLDDIRKEPFTSTFLRLQGDTVEINGYLLRSNLLEYFYPVNRDVSHEQINADAHRAAMKVGLFKEKVTPLLEHIYAGKHLSHLAEAGEIQGIIHIPGMETLLELIEMPQMPEVSTHTNIRVYLRQMIPILEGVIEREGEDGFADEYKTSLELIQSLLTETT